MNSVRVMNYRNRTSIVWSLVSMLEASMAVYVLYVCIEFQDPSGIKSGIATKAFIYIS